MNRPRLHLILVCVAIGLAVLIAGVAVASSGAAAKHGHHHHHHGQRGRPGATGPAGPQGPAGSGSLTLTYVSKTYAATGGAPPQSKSPDRDVACPDNQLATGGGVTSDAGANELYVESGSFEHGGGGTVGGGGFVLGGWDATVDNRDTVAHSLTVWAVCTPATAGAQQQKAGPRGPRGATGPAGPAGPAGNGSVSLNYVTKQFTGANGNTTGTAACPSGEHATDGGVKSAGPFETQWVTDTAPAAGGAGWTVSVDTFGSSQQFTVYAICTPSTVGTAPAAKRGPRGPRGAPGPAGPRGPSTPVATIPLTEVDADSIPAPAGQQSTGDADCPAGQLVIGGGYFADGAHNQMALNSFFPTDTHTSWEVTTDNTSNAANDFESYAACTPATAASG